MRNKNQKLKNIISNYDKYDELNEDQLDNMIFEEAYLLDVYKKNMQNTSNKNNINWMRKMSNHTENNNQIKQNYN